VLLSYAWKCCNVFISLSFWRSVLLTFSVLLLVIVIVQLQFFRVLNFCSSLCHQILCLMVIWK